MGPLLGRSVFVVALIVAGPPVIGQSLVLPDGDLQFADGTRQSIAGSTVHPMPRFEKNGDGTVTDHQTGLVWLENAGCSSSSLSYDGALAFANTLADGSSSHPGHDCGLSDSSAVGDWRVPNMFEAMSILDHLHVHEGAPFTNVQPTYWTSTNNLEGPALAHAMWTDQPFISSTTKDILYQVWPVRGSTYSGTAANPSLVLADGGIEFPDGSVQSTAAAVPRVVVPKTGQATCYNSSGNALPCANTGQDGDHQAGAAWPNPRFTKNLDGTVTDNLTGIVWLEKANCFGFQDWAGALAKASGLFDGATNDPGGGDCDLGDGSTPGEWRLPTMFELLSLAHMGFQNPALPNTLGTGQWVAGDPFSDLPLGHQFWWTSTTNRVQGTNAFWVYPRAMHSASSPKTTAGVFYVWPVKPPQ